jgi:hypothetical protein
MTHGIAFPEVKDVRKTVRRHVRNDIHKSITGIVKGERSLRFKSIRTPVEPHKRHSIGNPTERDNGRRIASSDLQCIIGGIRSVIDRHSKKAIRRIIVLPDGSLRRVYNNDKGVMHRKQMCIHGITETALANDNPRIGSVHQAQDSRISFRTRRIRH